MNDVKVFGGLFSATAMLIGVVL